MRSEYNRALKAIVEAHMAASPFGWQPTKPESPYHWSSDRAFSRQGPGEVLLWCLLVPDSKFERFTLEVGWSRRNRFPELSMRPAPTRPYDAHGLDEYLVRLGEISEGTDVWWDIEAFVAPASVDDLIAQTLKIDAPTARARVEPVAAQALDMLERFGHPYLRSIA